MASVVRAIKALNQSSCGIVLLLMHAVVKYDFYHTIPYHTIPALSRLWLCGLHSKMEHSCVVYSYTSVNDFSFEIGVLSASPKCDVHVFTPSPSVKSTDPKYGCCLGIYHDKSFPLT